MNLLWHEPGRMAYERFHAAYVQCFCGSICIYIYIWARFMVLYLIHYFSGVPEKHARPYIYIFYSVQNPGRYIYIYKIRIYARYQQTDCNLWWRNLRAVQKSKFPCISKRITMSISNETVTTTNSHQIPLVNITVVSNLLSMCARSEKCHDPSSVATVWVKTYWPILLLPFFFLVS